MIHSANYKQFLTKHKSRILWGIVLLLSFLLLLRACVNSGKKAPVGLPVVLAEVATADVPVYLDAIGTVTPTFSVTVISQIDGYLLSVLFEEGQMVNEGDLLAVVDPQPYQAQLEQYQGQLKRDKALLANAELDLYRYQVLWEQDSISEQTLATQDAYVQELEGQVEIDQGLIDATLVDLEYCNITSLNSGRVGLRLVDPGNFVQPSDTTGIAVINTIDPMTVIFVLPEDDIPQIMQAMDQNPSLQVLAYDRQQKNLLATGNLLTIDNQINISTGTVRLRANFKNDKNQLFPNQFVNARLLVETLKNVPLTPTAAIRYKGSDTYVYVKNEDNTVKSQAVKVGVSQKDNIVIKEGLVAGQMVVVEGGDKLVDGSLIRELREK